jgi:hypothetical protein
MQTIKILMLATNFNFSRKVLSCIQASRPDGRIPEIFILGNLGARQLKFSNFCHQFFVSGHMINGERDENLAYEMNHLIHQFGIEIVIPGDAISVRSVIANRDLLYTEVFPLPSLDQFDLLNDKSAFADICTKLNILHPETFTFSTVAELYSSLHVMATGKRLYPLIVKPLNYNGSDGVHKVDNDNFKVQLAKINYHPIVVQRFIAGEDIGAGVFARDGKIEAFVVHRLHSNEKIYSTFHDDKIFMDIAKIMSHFNLTGVFNFDMIRTIEGEVFYLECNPRIFFKSAWAMMAGVNFIEIGLGKKPKELQIPDISVRYPDAILRDPFSRWSAGDWDMLKWILADPLCYMAERLHFTA